MGKVEKIVVLSVLFLITLILVISLSGPAEDTGRLEPLRTESLVAGAAPQRDVRVAERAPLLAYENRALEDRASDRGEDEGSYEVFDTTAPDDAPPARESAPARASAPDRLLHASVGEEPVESTAGTLLRTQEGLLQSYLPEYRFYPWRRGDSWESVADRYYADAGGVERLQRANEGRTEIAPGEKILVPVIDLDSDSAPRPAAVPTRASDATSYVVADGDSLWKIAQRVYDSGGRWQEIFEANRDQLQSQHDLRVGQVLRIP